MMWQSVRCAMRPRFLGLLLPVFVSAMFVVGCRVDKVSFNRYQEGKKFLAADQPFQAMDYFQESIKRSAEKDTASAAKAYYVVAVARAADKVGPTHPDHAKYTAMVGPALDAIRNEPKSLEALVNLLANHDLSSQSAANLCVQLGASITPMLLEGYGTYAQVRKDVLTIFEHIGAAAIPDIVKGAQNTALAADLRLELVRLLGTIGGDEAQQALTGLANDPTRGIQVEAASALYRLGDKSQRDAIVAALDDPDVVARRAAANAMASFNDTPNTSLLVSHLKDTDALVRLDLVNALGKAAPGADGMNALIRVLQKDPDTDVANAAIPALAAYGAAVVPSALDALVTERDWPRRQRLIQVLKVPAVQSGFNQDLEYKLYEFYEKKETQANLKAELAELLKALEK